MRCCSWAANEDHCANLLQTYIATEISHIIPCEDPFMRRIWNIWIRRRSFRWLMSSDLVLSSDASSWCVCLGLPKHSSSFFFSNLRVMGIRYISTNPLKGKEKFPCTCRSAADSWRNGSSRTLLARFHRTCSGGQDLQGPCEQEGPQRQKTAN